jgi:HAD superfamily hydrolase (TIGR01549 family)
MADGSSLRPAGVPIPWGSGIIRAVLFDLDGTMYHQPPLRVLMALELSAATVTAPLGASSRWRALAAYRRVLEELRRERPSSVDGRLHLNRAAERSGVPAADLEQLVNEWMTRRPLKYLKLCGARGLSELLLFLERAGLACGVLSDYPATDKLHALGIAERFSVVISAADSGSLKPDPRGYREACRRWHLPPAQVLMVGDRVEVDAAGAAAAGMHSIIIGHRRAAAAPPNCVFVPSLARLHRVLADRA